MTSPTTADPTGQGKGGWTPGPWFAVQDHNDDAVWHVASNDEPYAVMTAEGHEAEANARLAASAPDLLRAILNLVLHVQPKQRMWSSSTGWYHETNQSAATARAQAMQAVSLATGSTSSPDPTHDTLPAIRALARGEPNV